MKKVWIPYLTILFLGMFSGSCLTPVQATEKRQEATFMILPKIPSENIGGSSLGYFNLNVKALQYKVLSIKVSNPTNQKVIIKPSVNNAQTTSTGHTTYLVQPTVPQMALIDHPLSKIIEGPPIISLAPNQSKWVEFKLKMPEKPLIGKSVGALILSSTTPTRGSFKNRYVYAVGVTLNGRAIKKQKIKYLKMPKVKVGLVQKKPAIRFAIRNPDAQFLKKGHMTIQLKNKKFGFYGYNVKLKDMQIAPQSQFWADSMLGGRRLISGDYQMTMTFKSRQYSQKIHKTVRISREQASYINQHNLDYQNRLRICLISIGCLAILALGIFVYYRYIRGVKR